VRRKKKKKFPKTHKFKVGETVIFRHAGSTRIGNVIEHTRESDRHATYTVSTSGNSRVYPCLGLDGSKPTGFIISDITNEYNKSL
jgi:hypothetical protein